MTPGTPRTGTRSTSATRPTSWSFEVDFCTVARWENGEIVEENLFYDVVGLMSQIGVGK